MVSDWAAKRKVNEFVDLLAVTPVKQFYPTSVPKYSESLTLESAFEQLIELCKSGEIHLLWEVKCPGESNFCIRTLDKVSDYQSIIDHNYRCDVCGKETCVTNDDVFPLFEIDEGYRHFMREEFKKKTNQTGRVRLKIKSRV